MRDTCQGEQWKWTNVGEYVESSGEMDGAKTVCCGCGRDRNGKNKQIMMAWAL